MGNELSVESKAKRKKYAKEYKLDAIGLVINQGHSTADVARQMNIEPGQLHKWVRAYKEDQNEAFRGNGIMKDKDKEIRDLKKALAIKEMECLILKKAAVFFAKDLSLNMR